MVLTAEGVKVDSLTAPAVPLLTVLIIIQRMLESDVKVCGMHSSYCQLENRLLAVTLIALASAGQ